MSPQRLPGDARRGDRPTTSPAVAPAAIAPPRAAGERTGAIQVWVPCQLRNHANHGGHWTKKAGYQKRLRERTQLLAVCSADTRGWTAAWSREPKIVSLEAYVWNLFDDHDGLRNACKPLVDGLVRARVIHDDSPRSGHTFLYTQRIDRQRRGVLITVTHGRREG